MTLQLAIKRLAMMLALLPTVAPDNPIGEMAADLENAICNVFDAAARESRPTSEPPEPPEGWGHPIAEEDK